MQPHQSGETPAKPIKEHIVSGAFVEDIHRVYGEQIAFMKEVLKTNDKLWFRLGVATGVGVHYLSTFLV